MTIEPSIIQFTPGKGYGQIDIARVWSAPLGDQDTPPDVMAYCSPATAEPSLMALDRSSRTVTGYRFDPAGFSLRPVGTTTLSEQIDTLSEFVIGGAPHLLGYRADTGEMHFYAIAEDLALRKIHDFSVSYGDVTSGFTTLQPYTCQDNVLVLAYNRQTGDAKIYQVQVPANAALAVSRTWSTSWSKGWHGFGFFTLGGENFFIKANTEHHDNVYIDHLADDPRLGSRPVGRNIAQLNPTALATLKIDGAPYFAALDGGGRLALNRIRVDCQGWVQAGEMQLGAGAGQLVAIRHEDGCYLFAA
jgi:hypothetical protein